MIVGFTGTRDGLTEAQEKALYDWAATHPWSEFHHGCCVGADAEAVEQFDRTRVQITGQSIVGHPSNMAGLTDRHAVRSSTTTHPEKPPLDRNRDIVDACEVLLACPKGPEERRSGTWSTIRYARKVGQRVVIFWPDGTVEG